MEIGDRVSAYEGGRRIVKLMPRGLVKVKKDGSKKRFIVHSLQCRKIIRKDLKRIYLLPPERGSTFWKGVYESTPGAIEFVEVKRKQLPF